MKKLLILLIVLAASMPVFGQTYDSLGTLDTSSCAHVPLLRTQASERTAAANGTLDSLIAYIYRGSGVSNDTFKMGLYRKSDSAFIDTTTRFVLSHTGWARVSKPVVAGGSIVNGTTYIMGVYGNEGDYDSTMRQASGAVPYWRLTDLCAFDAAKHTLGLIADGYRIPMKAIYHSGSSDVTAPGNHGAFTGVNVISIDPDTIQFTIGAEPAAADYDTTSIRFSTSPLANQGSGSSMWQGGVIGDTTIKIAFTVGNGNKVYFGIFAGDTVATTNWSTGRMDSVYWPANGNECPTCMISPFKQSVSGQCFVQSISGAGPVHRR